MQTMKDTTLVIEFILIDEQTIQQCLKMNSDQF